jgi:hypothetical protein
MPDRENLQPDCATRLEELDVRAQSSAVPGHRTAHYETRLRNRESAFRSGEVNTMPVVIRVHPQYGAGRYGMGLGLNGLGYGGYGVGGYAGIALRNERQKHNLQLKYERALFNERLKTVQLQTAVQSGGLGAVGYGSLGAVGGLYGARVVSPYAAYNPYQTTMFNTGFGAGIGGMFGGGLFGSGLFGGLF